MTSDPTNNAPGMGPDGARPTSPGDGRMSRGLINAGVVIAVLAAGVAGGAGATHYIERSRPLHVMLLQPTAIAKLSDRGPVAIKGQVADVFGNKFIVQDDSGRTLVNLGRRGEGARPVAKGETVTIQGRVHDGSIRADVMTRADGTTEGFGPAPHQHRRHGPDDRPGQRAERGPDDDHGAGRASSPPRAEL